MDCEPLTHQCSSAHDTTSIFAYIVQHIKVIDYGFFYRIVFELYGVRHWFHHLDEKQAG